MARSFDNLIQKYGVPYLVIPNTPRALSRDERRGVFSGPAVTRIVEATALYQRRPVGEEAFLLVKAQVEVPLNDFGDLETRLERDGVKIVEYRRWKDELVRLTLETDVTPITRDDIIHAVRRRRVVFVSDWRSMGDGYVDFAVATPGSLEDDDGYHFYFPSAPGAERAVRLPGRQPGAAPAEDAAAQQHSVGGEPLLRRGVVIDHVRVVGVEFVEDRVRG